MLYVFTSDLMCIPPSPSLVMRPMINVQMLCTQLCKHALQIPSPPPFVLPLTFLHFAMQDISVYSADNLHANLQFDLKLKGIGDILYGILGPGKKTVTKPTPALCKGHLSAFNTNRIKNNTPD